MPGARLNNGQEEHGAMASVPAMRRRIDPRNWWLAGKTAVAEDDVARSARSGTPPASFERAGQVPAQLASAIGGARNQPGSHRNRAQAPVRTRMSAAFLPALARVLQLNAKRRRRLRAR